MGLAGFLNVCGKDIKELKDEDKDLGDPHCECLDGLGFECNFHSEAIWASFSKWSVHAVAELVAGGANATIITKFAVRHDFEQPWRGSSTQTFQRAAFVEASEAEIDKAYEQHKAALGSDVIVQKADMGFDSKSPLIFKGLDRVFEGLKFGAVSITLPCPGQHQRGHLALDLCDVPRPSSSGCRTRQW